MNLMNILYHRKTFSPDKKAPITHFIRITFKILVQLKNAQNAVKFD